MKLNHTRGFSLIEALVALLVMGFGMLGVLGIQSSLRQYSDVSKQRSEAVRIAQESNETWRAFLGLNASAGVDYTDITSIGWTTPSSAIASATNTAYEIERIASNLPSSAQLPQSGLWLSTSVRWNDRAGAEQRISLFTHISGVSPEFAGTLVTPPAGTPGSPTRRPLGRHAAIPKSAIDGGTSSTFTPPGLPSTTWTFDNASGLITRICNPTCTTSSFVGALLSGFIRIADPTSLSPPFYVQPTPADAENPASSAMTFGSIGVDVDQTLPSGASVTCAAEVSSFAIAYYCALDISTGPWSGRSRLSGPVFSSDATDVDSTKARVCRYTPLDSDAAANEDHPLDYSGVGKSLANQNFLVIRGGDGLAPFVCPDDDPTTPYVNGNTFRHQPAS